MTPSTHSIIPTTALCNSQTELAFHPEVLSRYSFNPAQAGLFAIIIDQFNKLPDLSETTLATHRHRNHQSQELIQKLQRTISGKLRHDHYDWLVHTRHLSHEETKHFYSIDYSGLTTQDQLDLNLLPDDYILDRHGMRPIDGPAVADRRNSELIGLCVRNIARDDLKFVSDAKYCFTNVPWFIWGFDDYKSDDIITITEGIFDAIALRRLGFKAIALGSASPSPWQLACLTYKFKSFNVCLDNDLWGYCGALITHKCLRCCILSVDGLKDPGCILDIDQQATISTVSSDHVVELIDDQLQKLSDIKPQRSLPYN